MHKHFEILFYLHEALISLIENKYKYNYTVEFRLVYLSKYDHSLVHLASHVIRRPLVINTLYRLLLKCPPTFPSILFSDFTWRCK